MSVFISDIDTVEIYVQFLRPTTNLNINARLSRVVAYESLNTKKKSSWVIPKVVAIACESFSSQRLSQILNGVFTKAVVTSASRLPEWSQREPLLWGRGCFYTGRLRGQPPHHIIYHFWRKYPFGIPFINKWYPFHIPCLELCIPFNCCCTVI